MRLVILHYHIFKNAGTTIEDILDHSFGERFSALDVPGLAEPVSEAQLLRHLADHPELLAVSSHQLRHPVPVAPGYLFFDICFLRDPLERLRSTYDYYRQKPDPADPRSGLALGTTLGQFMAGMIEQFPLYVRNVQVNLLACRGDSDEPTEFDLARATDRLLETSFLGVVDRFDRSAVAGEYALRRAFPELDCARPAANVSRGLVGTMEARAAQMREACGDSVYQELLRLNALDFELLRRARVEVERRFRAVPDGEARLQELAARRTRPVPAAAPAPTPPAATADADPGIVTRIRRAVKLLPYLRVLSGSARKSLFDAGYYGGSFLRFLLHGGRAPHPLFDPAFYLRQNPQVARDGVNPLAHYLKYGATQPLQPHPVFDAAFYLDHSPDVRSAGLNPLVHYLRHGAAEGRKPHPLFDPGHYRKSAHLRPDDPVNPLVHFLAHIRDAASPHRLFDCAAWLDAHPDAGDVNPLVAHLTSGEPTPKGTLEIGDVAFNPADPAPHQRPFADSLRPDQIPK